MNNTEKVFVKNTFTNKYEEIEVSKEIATAYKRTGWNIDDNDESFFDHEIQFSQLIGGAEGAFENFKEFICDSNELQENLEEKVLIEQLHIALTNLDKKEKEIIDLLFFKKLTEREVAEIKGISQPMIHRKKQRILKKLKKFLI